MKNFVQEDFHIIRKWVRHISWCLPLDWRNYWIFMNVTNNIAVWLFSIYHYKLIKIYKPIPLYPGYDQCFLNINRCIVAVNLLIVVMPLLFNHSIQNLRNQLNKNAKKIIKQSTIFLKMLSLFLKNLFIKRYPIFIEVVLSLCNNMKY